MSFDLGAWGPGALKVKGPSLQGTEVSRYNGTVPVGFFGLAISFFKKIYVSNFIEQHSEAAMV